MEKKKFDKAIVIGRFEPPHKGHTYLFAEAEKLAKEVIVLCGSRNRSRSVKNPWRFEDRKIMLTLAIEEMVPELRNRVKFAGIADYTYNDQHWISETGLQAARMIYSGVNSHKGAYNEGPKVALIGHKKDSTSFYLDMFPQWKTVDIEPIEMLHATDIREAYFGNFTQFLLMSEMALPSSVRSYLLDWSTLPDWKRLKAEYDGIQEDKTKYAKYPYQESMNFVTTDAVVIESGHVLMIQRGGKVGNGLWALPGGFLNRNERILDGCIRELKEETDIDCPERILRGSIRATDVFDALGRDPRGRIITHGFLFELPSRASGLSKVKGCDDAAHAQWIPLYELEQMSEDGKIFSDHFDIIYSLIGKAKQ